MQKRKALVAAALASVFLAGTVTTASAARWHYRDYRGGYSHRGPGPVLGLLGAVVVGAATIATAPIAILANAGRPPDYNGPQQRGYYGPPPPSYGPGGYEDAPPPPPPPGYYRRNYGPPPGYYGGY
jgi:hypothetical protein